MGSTIEKQEFERNVEINRPKAVFTSPALRNSSNKPGKF
jgi:hypothetical protein